MYFSKSGHPSMASTLSWNREENKRDTVHLIVQALVEGKVVALPTATSYVVVASALHGEAGRRVCGIAEQAAAPAQLIPRSPDECLDFCPEMSVVARRLLARGFPGPIVVSVKNTSQVGVDRQLPEEVYTRAIGDEGVVSFRMPSHEIFSHVMQLMRGPAILAELFDDEGKGYFDGAAIEKLVCCDVVVDDGKTHFSDLATIVGVDGNQCNVYRQGCVSKEKLGQLSQFAILFVCTGNTCRSPMAEVIMRNMLAKRFGDAPPGAINGYHVASAGLSAFPGGNASAEAKSVAADRGLSLKSHQSQAVTEHNLRRADLVLTMTTGHRNAIIEQLPELGPKVHLVSGGNEDVSDPFGGTKAVYERCADQIEGYLENWVQRIEMDWLPVWSFGPAR